MSAENWAAAVQFVLEEEGGLVNDPHDPGGLTNYGISQRAYPDLDIRDLTTVQAMDIYHTDYWARINGDDLPRGVDVMAFDAAVNQGVWTARRLLQLAARVTTDNIIGPKTLAGIRHDGALTDYTARRVMTYADTHNYTKYGYGWMRRTMRAHALAVTLS